MITLAISFSEHINICSLQHRRTYLARHSVTICKHKNSALYKSSNKMLLLTGFYLGFFVWGRKSILKKIYEARQRREKIVLGLLGGSGGMVSLKILKDSVQDWLNSHLWTLVTFTDFLKSSSNQISI